MDGVKMWGDRDWGIAVFGTTEIERDPDGLADGVGGLVVVGVRERIAPEGMRSSEIVAERIAPDGTLPWAPLQSPIVLTVSSNRDDRPLVVKSR